MKPLSIVESIEQLVMAINDFRECDPSNRSISLIHDELVAFLNLKRFVHDLQIAKSTHSGQFVLRITPILHALLANEAHLLGKSMNALIVNILTAYFDKENLS